MAIYVNGKLVAGGGGISGGVDIPASEVAPSEGEWWLDTSEDMGEFTNVNSFNGRTGKVMPQAGDYTAADVGARPDTWLPTLNEIGAAPAGLAFSKNIYVDPAGSDETGDGKEANPYKTINHAISTIPQNLNRCTVKIYLSEGTYEESFSFYGFYAGVIYLIRKSGAATPHIIGNMGVNGCHNFQMSNIKVTGSIVCDFCNYVCIKSCEFDSSSTHAIRFNTCCHPIIVSTTVKATGTTTSSGAIWLTNNSCEIYNTTIESETPIGIAVTSGIAFTKNITNNASTPTYIGTGAIQTL